MIDQKEFIRVLKFMSHAMPSGDIRHYLNGVMFKFTEYGAELTSTDGHRLAIININFEHCLKGSYIIESKSIKRLIKVFPSLVSTNAEMTISINGNDLVFSSCDSNGYETTVNAKTVDGKYPDTSKVLRESINNKDGHQCAFNPIHLAEACKASSFVCHKYNAAKIISKGATKPVIIYFTGKIDCMASDAVVLIMPMRT